MSKKRKRSASLSQDDIVFAFLSAKVVCGKLGPLGNALVQADPVEDSMEDPVENPPMNCADQAETLLREELLRDVKFSVGFAPRGRVSAKLHASNNNQFVLCRPSWKILFGFHCTVQDWKKSIKGPWSRCVQRCKDDWETGVREGLKLAFKYCEDSTVYVSSEAKSRPKSTLLEFMQYLCGASVKTPRKKFWKLVLSKKNICNISKELTRLS